jgi:hypothetical protein
VDLAVLERNLLAVVPAVLDGSFAVAVCEFPELEAAAAIVVESVQYEGSELAADAEVGAAPRRNVLLLSADIARAGVAAVGDDLKWIGHDAESKASDGEEVED